MWSDAQAVVHPLEPGDVPRRAVQAGQGQALDAEAHPLLDLAGIGVSLGSEDREVPELPKGPKGVSVVRAVVDLQRRQGLPQEGQALRLLERHLLIREVVVGRVLVLRQVGGCVEGRVDGAEEGGLVAVLGVAAGKRLPAQTPDVGEASESLPVAYTGEALEIGFNADFLRDGLESVTGDEFVLKLISPLRPAVMTSSGDDFTYLIMPIRLAG